MSNRTKLTLINHGSGQRCRPKSMWRGVRPPRSVEKRHELNEALQDLRDKASLTIEMPRDPEEHAKEIIKFAEATGFFLTPWQRHVLRTTEHLPGTTQEDSDGADSNTVIKLDGSVRATSG